MRQRVLKIPTVYKTPGAYPSITLHQPDCDSWLKNQPLYYVVNSINTHQVLFSVTGCSRFLSQSPYSIKSREFFLGKLGQVEGPSLWFYVESLICFKLNNFPSIPGASGTANPHVVGSKARGKEECEGDTNTAQCFLSEKLHQGSGSSDLTSKQCQLLCSKSKLTCGGGSHVLSLMSLQLLMLQKKSWG